MSTVKKPVNVPASNLLASDLYKQGRKIEIQEHAEAEITKKGTLRGGSSGCLTDHGNIYGTCHRLALARYKGFQPEIEEISYIWFDAGFANEDAWMRKMEKAVKEMGPEYVLKAEEECPIVWRVDAEPRTLINSRGEEYTTPPYVEVTGRPDLMIFKKLERAAFEFKEVVEEPILGLELKVVCAVNSAVNIYCEDKPKISNLIQAAHYSMAHGCPFNLVYSFRNRSIVPGWASKFKDKLTVKEKVFPPRMRKDGTYGKEFVKREYSIEPFTKEFRVGFEDDKVYYLKDNGERVDTPLTGEGIRRYYELIVDMEKNKDLHTRIAHTDLEGKLLPYDPCNYCPFKDACDDFEYDYDAWMDKIELICEE